MKLIYKYLMFLLWSVAYIFLFGFVLNKYVPDAVSLLIFLVVIVIIHIVFTPKSEGYEFKTRLAEILIASVFLSYMSFYLYDKINQTTEEFIQQYDVEVVDYSLNITTDIAYFYNEEGDYCQTEFGQTKLVYTPEDPSLDYGDIIRIDEYKGFFGDKYYRFVKIVEKGSERTD